MTPEQREFLKSRGYTDELIQREGVRGVPTNDYPVEGRSIKDCTNTVMWTARSMSGQTIGYQTRELHESKYRWHQLDNTEHLPQVYGTEEDWDQIWSSGLVILTEGPFDRLAMKRALPEYAHLARLSKGIPRQFVYLAKRYLKTIWAAFDMDEAGREATEAAHKLLGQDLEVLEFRLPVKDPSRWWERDGERKMRNELTRQMDLSWV